MLVFSRDNGGNLSQNTWTKFFFSRYSLRIQLMLIHFAIGLVSLLYEIVTTLGTVESDGKVL